MKKGSVDAQAKFRAQLGIAILSVVIGLALISKVLTPPSLDKAIAVEAVIRPPITTQ